MAGRGVIRVGLLRNPSSTGNRARAFVPPPSDVLCIDVHEIPALPEALARMKAAGVGVLAIDGGDGTVREAMTRAPDVFGTDLPRIAILPHGNANLVARSAGSLNGPAALARLAGMARAGVVPAGRQVTMLHVDFPGSAKSPMRGFIIGWGLYETGTRIAVEEIATRGSRQVVGAFLTTLRRALAGAEARAIRQGVAATIAIDDRAQPQGRRLIGIATTLPGKLMAGLSPFWGAGDGALRWLDVDAPGYRLALATPFAAFGAPRRWMLENGYRSGRAERLDMRLGGDFVLDGETFETGPGGAVSLSPGERIEIISM